MYFVFSSFSLITVDWVCQCVLVLQMELISELLSIIFSLPILSSLCIFSIVRFWVQCIVSHDVMSELFTLSQSCFITHFKIGVIVTKIWASQHSLKPSFFFSYYMWLKALWRLMFSPPVPIPCTNWEFWYISHFWCTGDDCIMNTIWRRSRLSIII
jgi:hypothetical protein